MGPLDFKHVHLRNGRNIGNDGYRKDSFENIFIWYESAMGETTCRILAPHMFDLLLSQAYAEIYFSLGGYSQNTLVMGVIWGFSRKMKLIM